jgi:phage nucleotide-binding protein
MSTTLKMDEIKDVEQYLRVLLYGQAGAGKTELIGSFPKPIWIADFDGKYKPLIGQKDIEITSFATADITTSPELFREFKTEWRNHVKDPKWKTIALDSLTSFDTINLKYFCSLSKGGINESPTLPVYGDQSNYYSFFFSELKGVQKNVIITAHEFYNIDGDSGIHNILPLITGKSILHKLASQFEEIWYLERGQQDKRILHWNPFKKAIASSTCLRGTGELILPGLGSTPSAYECLLKQRKG